MKVRIGFQFWLSSTLYGYPKYILQDSPIRGLTKCCGESETKWIIIIYMTMLIRFLKKKKPTDAVRVARPPRIGVSPGFDSQDSVNFFTKYCFPNLHWIYICQSSLCRSLGSRPAHHPEEVEEEKNTQVENALSHILHRTIMDTLKYDLIKKGSDVFRRCS